MRKLFADRQEDLRRQGIQGRRSHDEILGGYPDELVIYVLCGGGELYPPTSDRRFEDGLSSLRFYELKIWKTMIFSLTCCLMGEIDVYESHVPSDSLIDYGALASYPT